MDPSTPTPSNNGAFHGCLPARRVRTLPDHWPSGWRSLPRLALKSIWFCSALGVLLGSAVNAASLEEREALNFFENQIRPVLANRCYECHGAKKQKSGLRLDTHAGFSKGGEGGVPVVVGKPDESILIKAVRRTDADLEMPPDDPLPPAEVALLEKWVAMGAPFPADVAKAHDEAARDEFGFTAEQRKHWVFQPIAKVTPPPMTGNRWVRNDIDRFVAAKHVELKLSPAPEADRSEFVRRVYFDLHGLPPSRVQ